MDPRAASALLHSSSSHSSDTERDAADHSPHKPMSDDDDDVRATVHRDAATAAAAAGSDGARAEQARAAAAALITSPTQSDDRDAALVGRFPDDDDAAADAQSGAQRDEADARARALAPQQQQQRVRSARHSARTDEQLDSAEVLRQFTSPHLFNVPSHGSLQAPPSAHAGGTSDASDDALRSSGAGGRGAGAATATTVVSLSSHPFSSASSATKPIYAAEPVAVAGAARRTHAADRQLEHDMVGVVASPSAASQQQALLGTGRGNKSSARHSATQSAAKSSAGGSSSSRSRNTSSASAASSSSSSSSSSSTTGARKEGVKVLAPAPGQAPAFGHAVDSSDDENASNDDAAGAPRGVRNRRRALRVPGLRGVATLSDEQQTHASHTRQQQALGAAAEGAGSQNTVGVTSVASLGDVDTRANLTGDLLDLDAPREHLRSLAEHVTEEPEDLHFYTAPLEADTDMLHVRLLTDDEVREQERMVQRDRLAIAHDETLSEHARLRLVYREQEAARNQVETRRALDRAVLARYIRQNRERLKTRMRDLQRFFTFNETKLQADVRFADGLLLSQHENFIRQKTDGKITAVRRRRWRVEWLHTPQPMRVTVVLLRALKDKVPRGQYVVRVAMMDELGGTELKWTKAERSGSCTLPVGHHGHFYSVELWIDQHLYMSVPAPADIQPRNVLLFELFRLADQDSLEDTPFGWGVLPIANSRFDIVEGQFRIPLLRGAVDSFVTRFERFETLMRRDLDNWLCNLYVEIAHLPRYHGGQREHIVSLPYKTKFLDIMEGIRKNFNYGIGGKAKAAPLIGAAAAAARIDSESEEDWTSSQTSSAHASGDAAQPPQGQGQQQRAAPRLQSGKSISYAAMGVRLGQKAVAAGVNARAGKGGDDDSDNSTSNDHSEVGARRNADDSATETSDNDVARGTGVNDDDDDDDEFRLPTPRTLSAAASVGGRPPSVALGSRRVSVTRSSVAASGVRKSWGRAGDSAAAAAAATASMSAGARAFGSKSGAAAGAAAARSGAGAGGGSAKVPTLRMGGAATGAHAVAPVGLRPLTAREAVAEEGTAALAQARGQTLVLTASQQREHENRLALLTAKHVQRRVQQPHPSDPGPGASPEYHDERSRTLVSTSSLENYHYNVSVRKSGVRESELDTLGMRKMKYIKSEMMKELHPRQARKAWYWVTVLMLLVAMYVRQFTHGIGQSLLVQALRIPLRGYYVLEYMILLEYRADLLSVGVEIAMIVIGPLVNILILMLMVLITFASQRLLGIFPDVGSRIVMCWGIATVLDPLITLAVDCAAQNFTYGDAFKLYVYFEAQEGAGIIGIFLTLLVYALVVMLAFFTFYFYLYRLHMNGRMLDVFNRLQGGEESFFLPDDMEISVRELRRVLFDAHRWRGQGGGSRRVAVEAYQFDEPPRGPKERARTRVLTHVMILNQALNGSSEMHRHFVRFDDGAFVEVFGNLETLAPAQHALLDRFLDAKQMSAHDFLNAFKHIHARPATGFTVASAAKSDGGVDDAEAGDAGAHAPGKAADVLSLDGDDRARLLV